MESLNANIILGGRSPEFQPPSNFLMRAMQMRQAQGQLQAQDRQAQAAERAIQDQNRLRSILEAGGGEEELIRGGFIEQGTKLGKDRRESKKLDLDAKKAELEGTAKRWELIGQVSGAATDQASWDRGLAALQQAGVNIDNLPPQFDPAVAAQGVKASMTGIQQAQAEHQRLTLAEQARNNDMTNARGVESNNISRGQLGVSQGNLAVNRGQLAVSQGRLAFDQSNPRGVLAQDLGLVVDPRTGVGTPITNNGVPVNPGATKPLTETQGNATNFAARMTQAEKIVTDLEAKGVNSSQPGTLAAKSKWTNWLATSEGQQYMQGARNWVTANLRKESGAAIPPAELDAEVEKYFPIVGDGAANIEQKRQARAVAREGMLVQAGPGAKQVEGIVQRGTGKKAPPKVGDVVDGFRFKGGDPGQQSSWEKV
jgi:hypothetical protein